MLFNRILESINNKKSDILNEQIDIRNAGDNMRVKNKNRYIMINNADEEHYARMKISRINRHVSDNINENISMYYTGDDVRYIGDMRNINISLRDYNEYEKLFMRNLNLIALNGTGCPSPIKNKYKSNLAKYVDIAFIHDEKLRYLINNNDLIIKKMHRDKFGDLYLYNKNNKALITMDLSFVVKSVDI